jgi:uncharacterized membrane protein YjjP (DUF1212 family)
MQSSEKLTNDMAELLLKISAMLMTAGANTNRILLIINKFSALMHVDAQVFINHKAFIISLTDKRNGDKTTQVKRLPAHVVNFNTLSGLSQIAALAKKEKWSFEKIKEEVDIIDMQPHHSRWLVLIAVSFAGAGLSILFGSDYYGFGAVFIGTFLGLFVKQIFHKRSFNTYLGTFAGTFISSLSTALILTLLPCNYPDVAIATSVLFSVPGVPLINSFTDFMDGYFLTGMVRFIHGLLYVLSIAAALFIILYLFNIQRL